MQIHTRQATHTHTRMQVPQTGIPATTQATSRVRPVNNDRARQTEPRATALRTGSKHEHGQKETMPVAKDQRARFLSGLATENGNAPSINTTKRLYKSAVEGGARALNRRQVRHITTNTGFTHLATSGRTLIRRRCNAIDTDRSFQIFIMNGMKATGRDSGDAAKNVLTHHLARRVNKARSSLGPTGLSETRLLFSGVANDNRLNSSPGSGDLLFIGKERALPEPHGDMPK